MPRAMAASRRKCWPRARRRSFTFLTVLHHDAPASALLHSSSGTVSHDQNDPGRHCFLGGRGRTGLERVLRGSVAERVVRNAPCAVLTVRQTPDATQGAKPKAAA